jgi:hypothetical protein
VRGKKRIFILSVESNSRSKCLLLKEQRTMKSNVALGLLIENHGNSGTQQHR